MDLLPCFWGWESFSLLLSSQALVALIHCLPCDASNDTESCWTGISLLLLLGEVSCFYLTGTCMLMRACTVCGSASGEWWVLPAVWRAWHLAKWGAEGHLCLSNLSAGTCQCPLVRSRAGGDLLGFWLYPVLKWVGPVNYLVNMHNHQCYTSICSESGVNQKQVVRGRRSWQWWESRYMPVWREKKETEIISTKQLTASQQGDLKILILLSSYADIMQDQPGWTQLVSYKIETKTTGTIRLYTTYRILRAFWDAVKKEEMLGGRIIEPAKSDWSAPIVLVTKKDGSLRLCVDSRCLKEMDAHPMPWIEMILVNVWVAYPVR